MRPPTSGSRGPFATITFFQGHYAFMAAFGFTVVGVGVLASLRPDGWRLTACVAGTLPAVLGVSSLLYPEASSSVGAVWALAAMAWGVAFVAAAGGWSGERQPRPRATGHDRRVHRASLG